MSSPSYVSGISSVPLIGETIGVHFDRAAERWSAWKRWWFAIRTSAGPMPS